MEEYAANTDDRFDCVLAINAIACDQASTTLTQIKRVLAPKGYICVAQLLKTDRIVEFEEQLRLAGLQITKSENLTRNALHALKILAKNQ